MSKLNPQKHFPIRQFIAAFAFAICTVWTQAGDWPQWRGPTSNAQVAKGDRLPARLGDSPKVVWRIDVGPGHSAPVTQGDRLAIAEEKDGFETLRLLDKRTGKDRKSTRLNSSHALISYAVFCLKKKKKKTNKQTN